MQRGRINSTEIPQGWSCNSGFDVPDHCTLPRCTNVVFPQTFSGSGTVSIRSDAMPDAMTVKLEVIPRGT